MTTPLEQIKERIENLVDFDKSMTEAKKEYGKLTDREVSLLCYGRARLVSDIQAIIQSLLPIIIQEVVDACISVVENKGGHGDKHMEKLKRKLFKDPDFKREYDSLTAHEELLRKDIVTDLASLKEESTLEKVFKDWDKQAEDLMNGEESK